jgi:hypothetical protein
MSVLYTVCGKTAQAIRRPENGSVNNLDFYFGEQTC